MHYLPCPAGLFIYSLCGEVPFPPSGGVWYTLATVTSFPHSKVAGQGPPLLPSPSDLFIYSLCGVPFPHSPELRVPCPLCYVVFFFQLLVYYSVFKKIFSLGGGQSVQGAKLICPRVYHMLLICSPGILHLPSRLGAGIWWCRSHPDFSI
jgi:hypothetical protein